MKIFICILVATLSACESKMSEEGRIQCHIEIRYIHHPNESTDFDLLVKCTNTGTKDIYTFAPTLNLYIKGVLQDIAMLRLGLPSNRSEQWAIMDRVSDSIATINIKLENKLKSECQPLFKDKDSTSTSIYLDNIATSIFLKSTESICLRYALLDVFMDDSIAGNLTFVAENISKNNKRFGKAFSTIYKDIPASFHGYSFWNGDMISDSIKIILCRDSCDGKQSKFVYPTL